MVLVVAFDARSSKHIPWAHLPDPCCSMGHCGARQHPWQWLSVSFNTTGR